MVEARGETILDEEEETSQEQESATVLWMSLVEDRFRTPFSQVVIGFIKKKFNFIIVRNLVIMHMNVERSTMTKKAKPELVDEHQHFVECYVDGM